ncbi:hypothetical protein [Herbiconiux solani]|uniref:hypothetical protein n=1 Tax=Herbiconiux solani TaxID=661329 RepID=UPI0012ED927A|nr:hypothetical protein [Herbiconiux solani]
MDKPRLIVVDRAGELPGGSRYVLSFVELWPERVVVRMVGLTDGVGRELAGLGLSLRDDGGHEYEWVATTSGGMVLPEEVSIGFEGPVREGARSLELGASAPGVLQRIQIT